MPPRIGYLLPTRERVMAGRPETRPLERQAGRVGWTMAGRRRSARPDALSIGRPADLDGRVGAPGARTAARYFDGWFANEASLARWSGQWER
jgi:hypothetical protein